MTTSDTLIAETGKNIQEKATLIWNVANTLFGAFKPHEYGLVILPMVVIKRFHDCLLPTHQAVLDTYKKVEHLAVKEGSCGLPPDTNSTTPALSPLRLCGQTRRTSTTISGPISMAFPTMCRTSSPA
mgnify:CR=1 FL=1